MRIIDPHCHMYSRTVDDYELMLLCGIEWVTSFHHSMNKTAAVHAT